jgi:phage tail tape-measure protein
MLLVGAAALVGAACTSTGNVERGAVLGGAVGAAAGAAIGNNVGDGDARRGAAIGGAVGAAAGAYQGCRQDGNCGAQPGAAPVNRREFYDPQRGRYYFYDRASGRYFYENGQPYP